MEPKKVAFNVDVTMGYLTNEIARLSKELAFQYGIVANYEKQNEVQTQEPTEQ